MKTLSALAPKLPFHYGFLLLLLLAGFAAQGQAPTISYVTPQVYTKNVAITPLQPTETGTSGGSGYGTTNVVGSGFSQPYGVAADAAGNIYVGDKGNNAVKKIPAGGGPPITLGSGFNATSGVAVDAAGNVYVADYGNNAVKEIPAGGGSIVTLGSGFNGPIAVAVDGSGNVYVADKGNNAIKEIPAGNGTPVTLGTSFSGPSGVAVDGFGNVYVADSGHGAIKEIYKAGGGVVTLVASQTNPQGVAVDAAGIVYFSTAQANGVSTYNPNFQVSMSLGLTGITSPANLFVDQTGKIEIADQGGNLVEQVIPNNAVFINKYLPAGLVFYESEFAGPTYTYVAGTIAGTPTTASPATNYTVTAYEGGVSTSTTLNITVSTIPPPVVTYASPQTFYEGISVNVTPSGSNTAPVSFSANPATISTNTYAYGITRDASNILYFTNSVFNTVCKLTPGGTAITIASGFNTPEGLAVDASGNIYVADAGDGTVKKIPAGGSAPITIASGLSKPTDVAVDASGNVFVAVENAGKVEELPAGGGTPITIGSGFTHPISLKFDKAGNLFIADNATNKIYEIPAGGGAQITTNYSASTSNKIEYIAIDASENIFFTTLSDVYLAPADGGAPYLIAAVGASRNNYADLTIDDSDNIYICASNIIGSRLLGGYFVTPNLPAALSLNHNTGAITGTPTTIAPAANYTVQAFNADANSSTVVNIRVTAPPLPTISYTSPQTVYYGNAITPIQPAATNVGALSYASTALVEGSGFKMPTDEVVDAAGNIYVADQGNFFIKKIPAGGGTPVTICPATPYGIALDGSGNIYFSQGTDVYKVAAGSSTKVVFGSGFNGPKGIAADAAGDIYVAESGNNDVKMIPAAGGTPVIVATGFKIPTDVALDAAGNLYIADYGNSAIKKMPASGGAALIVATLSFNPAAVAVDDAGYIYTDGVAGNTYELVVIPAGGSTMSIGSGFSHPIGLALDKSHNLYVADSGNNEIKKFLLVGGYFITPVLPAGLLLNASTGIISGTPSGTSPATNYTITGCNYSGSASATLNLKVTAPPLPTISYATPQNYTIGIAITPLSPVSTNVYPFGYSSTVTSLGSGFNLPTGVTHDGAGNIYVADNGNNAVKKIPSGGGTPVTIGSGFSHPTGITLDAPGNIYVADAGNNAIKKIPAGSNTPVSIGSGFNAPTGVAVDPLGNIYIADAGNNAVKEIPLGSNTPITLASGFNNPYSVAVDGAGYIYVADVGNNYIKRIPPGGGTPVFLYNVPGVYGVAISPGGNLYYSSVSTNSVVMIPAGSTTPQTIATGFNSPVGLMVSGAGNVYVADEGNNIIKQVKPAGGYFIVPFLPAGLSFSPNTGVISGTPTTISPSQKYIVTAYNVSGTKQATVNIAVSANDNLANLSLSTGTLSPAFTPGTTGYTASVGAAVSSIKVIPTATDPAATIKVNGTTVASGAASGPITLNTGANTITIVVTAVGGVTVNTYTITVTRVPSNDANLASLRPSTANTPLTPSFSPGVYNYSVGEGYVTTAITFTPKTADANATVTINGQLVVSGTASQSIPLQVGPNTITTVVTAQDGVTTQTYTFTVNRTGSDNAYLSGLLPSAGPIIQLFKRYIFGYTSNVDNSVSSITISPTTADPNATIAVNGTTVASGIASAPIALSTGENTITTTVTAQDGVTTKTYIITVTKGLPDANLVSVTLSSGAVLSLPSSMTNYSVTVGNDVSSVTMTPVTSSTEATVTITGVTVASGTASRPITLRDWVNVIPVVVTAADGVTTKTYTVTVIRTPANFAWLAFFTLNGGAVPYSPSWNFRTMSYTANVANSTSTITITPVNFNDSESITVNGTPVASHAASGPVPLAVGPNTISIVVTAQDGVTQQTYTVTVTRASGGADAYQPISVSAPDLNPLLMGEDLKVHQGVSPNGDGINDVLTIENINNYPQNKLMIMDRNGAMIYQAKGYDNVTKAFDGHSNITGQMQLPGTYFYALDYAVNGVTKRKTGFIVLKY